MTDTTKTVQTVHLRQLFAGMPKAERLIGLMLMRGADNFLTLLDTDWEFRCIFSESVFVLARQAVEKELRANGWHLWNHDKEDAVQDLVLHILEAVRKFDQSRGTSLICFLNKFLLRSRDLIVKIIRRKDLEDLTTDLEPEDEDVDEDDEQINPSDFIVDVAPSPEEQAIINDTRRYLIEEVTRGRRTREVAEQQLEDLLDQRGNKVSMCRFRKDLRKAFEKMRRLERSAGQPNLLTFQISETRETNRRCH